MIEKEGPYDGVIGYSEGAAVAAQLLIRDARTYPWKLAHERVFRWAVFINGGSPIEAFRLAKANLQDIVVEASNTVNEALSVYLRGSNTRARKGDEQNPNFEADRMEKAMMSLQTKLLADGRVYLTDGAMGIARYDGTLQGTLIDVPTLHVRCPAEEDRHHGLHLVEMCEPALVKEYHHRYGHDFPRGRAEMNAIAQLIRETSELGVSV